TVSRCHDGPAASRGLSAARAACPCARRAGGHYDVAAGAHPGVSLGRPRGRRGLRLSGHPSLPGPGPMTGVVLLVLLWALPAGGGRPRRALPPPPSPACLL